MTNAPAPKRKTRAPKEPKPLGRPLAKGKRKDFVARLPHDMVAEMDAKTSIGFSRNDIVTEAVGDWLKTRRDQGAVDHRHKGLVSVGLTSAPADPQCRVLGDIEEEAV